MTSSIAAKVDWPGWVIGVAIAVPEWAPWSIVVWSMLDCAASGDAMSVASKIVRFNIWFPFVYAFLLAIRADMTT